MQLIVILLVIYSVHSTNFLFPPNVALAANNDANSSLSTSFPSSFTLPSFSPSTILASLTNWTNTFPFTNQCASNPCHNDAFCRDIGGGQFRCDCKLGFKGALCDVNIDDCASNPCHNNGHCFDLVNDFKCDCSQTGFEGRLCEININECLSQPCSNGASHCEDLVLNFTCNCYEGFTGRLCDIDIKECDTEPCQNGGICFEKSDQSLYNNNNTSSPFHLEVFHYSRAAGYICQCPKGITGGNCEININECETAMCLHNGTCIDGINGYSCRCPDGYEGM